MTDQHRESEIIAQTKRREEIAPLIKEAREKGLWFNHPYIGYWASPDTLERMNAEGRYLFSPSTWRLRSPSIRIDQIDKEIARLRRERGEITPDVDVEPGDLGMRDGGGWADGIPSCDVCGRFALHLRPGEPLDTERDRLRVSSVPGVPYSAAYCEDCTRGNAHPYGIIIGNVANAGGLDGVTAEVVEMVESTAKRLGKSMEEVRKDIDDTMRDLEARSMADAATYDS
jgi:hypothetical protein